MLRLRASSASSRGVQWLMGRADASGGSQASAMIWHHCSALKVAGAPGRGASCKRAGTAQPGRLSQWRRQRRTVVRVVPRRRATSGAGKPSANRRIICARKLRCWGVLWARIIVIDKASCFQELYSSSTDQGFPADGGYGTHLGGSSRGEQDMHRRMTNSDHGALDAYPHSFASAWALR
jgi:hypothetical protein